MKYSRMTHLQFDKDDEVLYSASYIYEAKLTDYLVLESIFQNKVSNWLQ